MPPVRASSFGRRGAPETSRASLRPTALPGAVAALHATESGIPLEQLARDLLGDAKPAGSAEAGAVSSAEGRVPWSWRAAMLAGIAAASLQAGLIVLSSQSPTPLLPGLPWAVGGAGSALTPAVIAYGLWNGGSNAATTMMVAHFGLRAVRTTSPLAYALGGAVVGAAASYLMRTLLGGDDTLATDAITGLLAGFLYRMIAGARAAA